MSDKTKLIWKKGNGEMPERVQKNSESAKDELLLMTLDLPVEAINTIRYNADKNAKSVNHYICEIVLNNMISAS